MLLKLKNPIICALDVDSKEKALKIVYELKDSVGAYKIGPRFNVSQNFLDKVQSFVPVFLDYKYYDIPSTVLAAVKNCINLNATIVTVHASLGLDTLKKLKELELKVNQNRPFYIACVTVLTSQDQLLPNWKNLSISEHVDILTDLVVESGLNTVVCSGLEIERLKSKFKNLNIITPGIKFNQSDQKRVVTLKDAIKSGANGVVIGRKIIESSSPLSTLNNLLP